MGPGMRGRGSRAAALRVGDPPAIRVALCTAGGQKDCGNGQAQRHHLKNREESSHRMLRFQIVEYELPAWWQQRVALERPAATDDPARDIALPPVRSKRC